MAQPQRDPAGSVGGVGGEHEMGGWDGAAVGTRRADGAGQQLAQGGRTAISFAS